MKYNDAKFPKWAEYIGWCIALSSIVAIPIYAIILLLRQTGTFQEVINICRLYLLLFSSLVFLAMEKSYDTNIESKSIDRK